MRVSVDSSFKQFDCKEGLKSGLFLPLIVKTEHVFPMLIGRSQQKERFRDT